MNFENNPCIRPPVKEESFNQIKVIDERVNTLEKSVSDMADNIETKELNVTETAHIKNLEVENQSTTYESLSADNFTLNQINEETPILSTKVVGYDENGKLIPIEAQYEGFDLYDYIVDSQEKFNTLITLAKSAGGLTFKNVAIVGGYGDGTSGDYIYSPTETTNFNKANIVGYKSAKITVNVDDITTDDLVVFNNIGTFKNIDISAIGVVSTYDVVMFKNSTLNDLIINHTSYNPPYSIESCTLNNVVNKEYITFKDCHLNNIETVQSEFEHCDSNHMYVKQNENENRKYKFTNCGLHLDTLEDDVTIDVAIVTKSTLYCFDNQVNNKSFTLKIDDCDEESIVIGNKVTEELHSPIKTMISDAKKLGYVKYLNEGLDFWRLGYDILDRSRTLIKRLDKWNSYTTIDYKGLSIFSYTLKNTTGTFIGYGDIAYEGDVHVPKIARSIKDYLDGRYIDSTSIASYDLSNWHFVPITNMCDYYYKNADVYSCTDSDDTSHTVVYYVKNDILYRVYRTAECKPKDIISKIRDRDNNTIYYKYNNEIYTDLSLTTLASSTHYDYINWNITTIEKIKTVKALYNSVQGDDNLNKFGINMANSKINFNPYDVNGNLVTMYVQNGQPYIYCGLFSFDSENIYEMGTNKKVSLSSSYQTLKSYYETEGINYDSKVVFELYTPSLNYNVFVETPKNKYINTRGALYLKYVG